MSKKGKKTTTTKSPFTNELIKLIKIRRALPSKETLAVWGPGARTFVEKLTRILEE